MKENENNVFEVLQFEGNKIDVIIENDEPLFEIYSTGAALGYTRWNGKRTSCTPQKERIYTVIKNAEITPCVRDGHRYINEYQLYDFMLEAKTDKVKPFRKWLVNDVVPAIRKTGGYIPVSEEDTEEVILSKAFFIATKTIEQQKVVIENKEKENRLLTGKILEWEGRPIINALVRAYGAQACFSNWGEAWVVFKKELLYKHGINLNSRTTAYLNSTGKKTKPRTLDMLDDTEISSAVSTAVAMCREKDVNIDEILNNYK